MKQAQSKKCLSSLWLVRLFGLCCSLLQRCSVFLEEPQLFTTSIVHSIFHFDLISFVRSFRTEFIRFDPVPCARYPVLFSITTKIFSNTNHMHYAYSINLFTALQHGKPLLKVDTLTFSIKAITKN